jgi:hypothetical protein
MTEAGKDDGLSGHHCSRQRRGQTPRISLRSSGLRLLDQWTVVCRDGNEYSINVEPNAKDSVCVGNAFDRSAWLRRM